MFRLGVGTRGRRENGKDMDAPSAGMHGSTSLIGASLAENITRIYLTSGIGFMQDVDDLLQSGGQEVVEEASVKWLNFQAKKRLQN